jgi:hypothetical protein
MGNVMYFIATGEAPLAHLTPLEAARAAACASQLPTFPPHINQKFVALTKECWAADPNQRPDAVSLQTRLADLLATMQGGKVGTRGGWPCCVCV